MKEIKPTNNNGSIQIRFRLDGKRYGFNPVPGGTFGDKRDMATAQAIAIKIQNDILAGHFDPTLDRYRLTPKQAPAIASPKPKTLLGVWDAWVDTLGLAPATKADHYEMIRRMMLKAAPGLTDTDWLTQAAIAPATFNKRLGYVRSCCNWAVSKGLLDLNPYAAMKPRKSTPKEIKPFTLAEIRAIVRGFEDLCPHYVPFVKFLLMTGVRTSEAIGLTWEHIDFDRGILAIRESMPKDRAGNGYRRIRKETKTGSIRHLTLSPDLRELLEAIKPAGARLDGLVFRSPKGCVIDAGNFREDHWVRVLKACGIPYRNPYTTRHTMISHAIEQGIPLTGVSYLAGHKDTRMVMQTYGHMVNRPALPQLQI